MEKKGKCGGWNVEKEGGIGEGKKQRKAVKKENKEGKMSGRKGGKKE